MQLMAAMFPFSTTSEGQTPGPATAAARVESAYGEFPAFAELLTTSKATAPGAALPTTGAANQAETQIAVGGLENKTEIIAVQDSAKPKAAFVPDAAPAVSATAEDPVVLDEQTYQETAAAFELSAVEEMNLRARQRDTLKTTVSVEAWPLAAPPLSAESQSKEPGKKQLPAETEKAFAEMPLKEIVSLKSNPQVSSASEIAGFNGSSVEGLDFHDAPRVKPGKTRVAPVASAVVGPKSSSDDSQITNLDSKPVAIKPAPAVVSESNDVIEPQNATAYKSQGKNFARDVNPGLIRTVSSEAEISSVAPVTSENKPVDRTPLSAFVVASDAAPVIAKPSGREVRQAVYQAAVVTTETTPGSPKAKLQTKAMNESGLYGSSQAAESQGNQRSHSAATSVDYELGLLVKNLPIADAAIHADKGSSKNLPLGEKSPPTVPTQPVTGDSAATLSSKTPPTPEVQATPDLKASVSFVSKETQITTQPPNPANADKPQSATTPVSQPDHDINARVEPTSAKLTNPDAMKPTRAAIQDSRPANQPITFDTALAAVPITQPNEFTTWPPSILNEQAAQTVELNRNGATQQMAEVLLARASNLPTDKSDTFVVQIEPPELGRMIVQLRDSGGKLEGQILVAHHRAFDWVEQELPIMRQSLHEAGIDLSRLDVARNDNSTDSWQQFEQQQNHHSPTSRAARHARPAEHGLENLSSQEAVTSHEGVVDLVV